MGTSTWTGPIKAGNILNTTGTTVGKDVKNVGWVVMTQVADITQAGTTAAAKTGIVLPANSEIIEAYVMVTAGWSGVAKTISFGTTVTSTELTSGTDLTNIGQAEAVPGTDATRTAKFMNVGTSDVAIWALSANTGTGTGRLVVQYAQAINA